MTRHFVRKFQTLGVVTVFVATFTILFTAAFWAQEPSGNIEQASTGFTPRGTVNFAQVSPNPRLSGTARDERATSSHREEPKSAFFEADSGSPLFLPAVTYGSGGTAAMAIAIGDLNSDGKLDVVAVNSNGNDDGTVGVLLGKGDGTFQPVVTYDAGGNFSVSVALADVNGDGKLDIVVGSFWDSDQQHGLVSVLLGNGNGTFQPAVSYNSGGVDAASVAIADVNGDGKPDLIVANCAPSGAPGCPGGAGDGNVAVLLGRGDGTFETAVTYDPGGYSTSSLAVADVNGDGIPDIIVSNLYACDNCSNGNVSVLLGHGDGTFQAAVSYSSGDDIAWGVSVGDINGDGKPDLLVAAGCPNGFCGGGVVAVLLGNGNGTFQAASTYDSGGESTSVTVADVNGDGKPDLVALNWCTGIANGSCTTEGSAGVLIGNGDGSFQPAAVFDTGGYSTGAVVRDINGDGKPDILVSNYYFGTIGVLLGNNQVAQPTTTTLTTSKNPAIYQQPVTFTAAVTSSSGTPAGTVVFIEDGKHVLASETLVNGSASFTTSGLARGKYAMTAAYLGSGNFAPSTSAVLEQWVNRNGLFVTHIVLRSSGSPSLVGQPVTFTATVTSKYGAIPDGDLVDFSSGRSGLGSAPTRGGVASITTSSLPAGVHTIDATYEGDENFHSKFTEQKQTVDKDPTNTVVSASPNPAVYGQAITYTATVKSTFGTPTGNVRISELGLVPLINGVATITKTLVRAGTHAISAAYQGDSDFARSTSPVFEEVVNPTSTTTAVTSSANPSSSGQIVTFTATVTSAAGLNPFGTVTFTAGTVTLGTVALKDTIAHISTAALPVGSTTVTATYNGADSFTGSSASLTQVVQP